MTDGTGNTEMVRIIAEQLFETWKSEQAREAKETRRWFSGNLGNWLGAAVVVGTFIVTASNTYNIASSANARSIRNENAITAMKADNGDRLARIETKIDLMMEERKK